jgi:hypothetical protein
LGRSGTKKYYFVWDNQILVGINRSPTAVLVQFNGSLLISDQRLGMFLITLNLFFFYVNIFLCLFGDWVK